jgi:hypothetical protein
MYYTLLAISTIVLFGTAYFVEEICYKHCRVRKDYYESYGKAILHKKDK